MGVVFNPSTNKVVDDYIYQGPKHEALHRTHRGTLNLLPSQFLQ